MLVVQFLKCGDTTKMAWGKNGSKTLIADSISCRITDLTASKFNTVLGSMLGAGTGRAAYMARVEGITNNGYSSMNEGNGTGQDPMTNDEEWQFEQSQSYSSFIVYYMANMEGYEKLVISRSMDSNQVGNYAPNRRMTVGKYVITAGQITDVEYINNDEDTATLGIGTNVTVLGSDMGVTSKPYGTDDSLAYTDDFSTDKWTDNGATTHVTGGSLVWNSDTTDNGCSLDMLGSTISDTAWVARFKFTVANFDSGTGNHQFQFLVSDKANLDVATTSRDSLGFKIIKATSDEYALAWKNGGTISSNTEVAFAHSAQAETIYVEMSRLSSTFKVEFFSDSNYISSIESETATISGVVDLRYLIAIEQDINGSATMNGTIDDFKFYNGVSTVTRNLSSQSGSRIEETDTRKIYYKDDVDFKELDGVEATNYRSESWYEQLSGEIP